MLHCDCIIERSSRFLSLFYLYFLVFLIIKNKANYQVFWRILTELECSGFKTITAWKVSKYGVFSGLYFPAFGLNTERYEVSLCIQSECRKIRTRKNSVFGHISHSAFLERWVVCYVSNVKKSKKWVNFMLWWRQQLLEMSAEVIFKIKLLLNLWQTFLPSFMPISWVVTYTFKWPTPGQNPRKMTKLGKIKVVPKK